MASQVQRMLPSSSSPRPLPLPLPVINLARLGKDPATRALAIQDIARACREQGCFQVSACCCVLLVCYSVYHPNTCSLVCTAWSAKTSVSHGYSRKKRYTKTHVSCVLLKH
jgi:hypothetical protein